MKANTMVKTTLIYGAAAGALTSCLAVLSLALSGGQETHLASLEWLGYLTMILALSAIFVGVKRYRDAELGGVITFGRAFAVGLGISVTAGIVYASVWEVNLAATDYAFIHDYTASLLEAKMAGGATEMEVAAFASEMEEMRTSYANPLYRFPLTFAEIFPVGLLISLIAAAVLRTRGGRRSRSIGSSTGAATSATS